MTGTTFTEITPTRQEDVDRERLRDAAEDLLAACQLFVAYDDSPEADVSDVAMMLAYAKAINAARTAIARATGERS